MRRISSKAEQRAEASARLGSLRLIYQEEWVNCVLRGEAGADALLLTPAEETDNARAESLVASMLAIYPLHLSNNATLRGDALPVRSATSSQTNLQLLDAALPSRLSIKLWTLSTALLTSIRADLLKHAAPDVQAVLAVQNLQARLPPQMLDLDSLLSALNLGKLSWNQLKALANFFQQHPYAEYWSNERVRLIYWAAGTNSPRPGINRLCCALIKAAVPKHCTEPCLCFRSNSLLLTLIAMIVEHSRPLVYFNNWHWLQEPDDVADYIVNVAYLHLMSLDEECRELLFILQECCESRGHQRDDQVPVALSMLMLFYYIPPVVKDWYNLQTVQLGVKRLLHWLGSTASGQEPQTFVQRQLIGTLQSLAEWFALKSSE